MDEPIQSMCWVQHFQKIISHSIALKSVSRNHECEIIAFICSGKNRVKVYGGVTGVFTSSGFRVSLWESAEKCIG